MSNLIIIVRDMVNFLFVLADRGGSHTRHYRLDPRESDRERRNGLPRGRRRMSTRMHVHHAAWGP